jgi:hypothetical protein
MSSRVGRVKPQRLCMVILPPRCPKVLCFKQFPQAPAAAIIMPWIDIITGQLKEGKCALSMTNSTTYEGWLGMASFIKEEEDPVQATIRFELASHHATHYLLNGIRECNQWFCGVVDNVPNGLFWDIDRTGNKLTQILPTCCPSQLPQHFKLFCCQTLSHG